MRGGRRLRGSAKGKEKRGAGFAREVGVPSCSDKAPGRASSLWPSSVAGTGMSDRKGHANPKNGRCLALTPRDRGEAGKGADVPARRVRRLKLEPSCWGQRLKNYRCSSPPLHGFRRKEGVLGGGPPTISFVFPLSFLWFSISSRERPGRRAERSLQRAATARTADGNWVKYTPP